MDGSSFSSSTGPYAAGLLVHKEKAVSGERDSECVSSEKTKLEGSVDRGLRRMTRHRQTRLSGRFLEIRVPTDESVPARTRYMGVSVSCYLTSLARDSVSMGVHAPKESALIHTRPSPVFYKPAGLSTARSVWFPRLVSSR